MSERRQFDPDPYTRCWIDADGTSGYVKWNQYLTLRTVTKTVERYAAELREKLALAEEWLAAAQEAPRE